MILSIGSSLPGFKCIAFHVGLNVLLSDTHPGASERQTRNSAGKTSLIEIIHFLLGADCRRESLFRSPALVNHSFFGEFALDSDVVAVERTGSSPSKIYVSSGFHASADLLSELKRKAAGGIYPMRIGRPFLDTSGSVFHSI